MDNEDCFSQNVRSLEDYVEDYQELKARWDDETLKQHFWSRVDNILGQMLLLHGGGSLSIQCGSSLNLGIIEDNNAIISDSPGLSTPPAVISVTALEITLCPGQRDLQQWIQSLNPSQRPSWTTSLSPLHARS